MQEILPGVWHWTAEHPDIHKTVSSYYLEPARVALDPLLPEEGLAIVEDRPVDQVILTNRLHGRDAAKLHEALGCTVRVPEAGVEHFEDSPFPVQTYTDAEDIAPGVRTYTLAAISPDDGVLHIDAGPGALHFADGLLVRDGALALMPDELMDDPQTVRARTLENLVPLLELDFDALLFAHSDPIAEGGRAQLEAFVADNR